MINVEMFSIKFIKRNLEIHEFIYLSDRNLKLILCQKTQHNHKEKV